VGKYVKKIKYNPQKDLGDFLPQVESPPGAPFLVVLGVINVAVYSGFPGLNLCWFIWVFLAILVGGVVFWFVLVLTGC
jgi:hypothetical protein